MFINVLEPKDLTAADVAAWSALVRRNPSLSSPFFSPFFTMTVASVRRDVYIAKLVIGSECVGFFPFQRDSDGNGDPAGGGGSDCHGVVSRNDLRLDASALVSNAGLSSWRYHHLPAAQSSFTDYHVAIRTSPTIELQLGFDRYRRGLGSRKTQFLAGLERKESRLTQEIGKVTFESHVSDPSVLTQILRWKGDQMARASLPDYETWEKEFLRRISQIQEPGFRGTVSVLYAGDQLVAAHLGLASDSTWHYWYPAYNQEFAQYSPGLLLLFRMVRETQALGLARIDLGKTTYQYKRSFMNSAVLVAEGAVLPIHRQR